MHPYSAEVRDIRPKVFPLVLVVVFVVLTGDVLKAFRVLLPKRQGVVVVAKIREVEVVVYCST